MNNAIKDFTFNKTSLSSFENGEYIVASFEDSDSTDVLTLNVNHSDLSYDNPVAYYYDTAPSDVLTIKFSICRKDGEFIKQDEIRKLNSWLMAPTEPKVLSFTPCNSTTAVYYNVDFIGNFTAFSLQHGGSEREIGVTYTFTNISSYAFTKQQEYTITATTSATKTITNTGTATGRVVFPEITILDSTADSETVTINNESDTSRDAFSINVLKGIPVTISDCNLFDKNGELYGLSCLNNFNWPVLVDGDNKITVTGACTVTIKVRYFENVGY